MTLIQLPDSYSPDFAYPDKKPLGPFELNLQNNLIARSTYFYSGRGRAPLSSTDNSTLSYLQGTEGREFADGTQQRITITDDDVFRLQTFTAILRFSMDSLTTNNGYFWNMESRLNFGVGIDGITAENIGISWFDGTTFRTFNFGAPSSLGVFTMAISRIQGVSTTGYQYINGNKTKIVNTTNLSDVMYNASRPSSFGARAHAPVANGMGFAMHEFLYIPEALTEGEIDNYVADPYQVLTPSIATVYYKSSGVAPVGRIMGSLAGDGGLAGRGGLAGTGGGLAA